MEQWKKLLFAVVGSFFLATSLTAVTPIVDANPVHEAFISKIRDITPNIVVQNTPPELINERIPAKPSMDAIWIPGYWAWLESENDYVWICGVWRKPPPNKVWISGNWVRNQGGWVWAQGFWSSVNAETISYINKVPPSSIDDQVPPSPGNNHFWIPGYWEYSLSTKNYTWLSGKWQPFNQNWVLTPASYIWRPEGYVFVPMYWDFHLDARGKAYACSEPGMELPRILEPEIIVQQLFFYYPDYIILFCDWWHFHPGWWDDCWCAPPWWFWPDWWAFPWADMWGLWWWWGHPGFFPPFWITLELSLKIAPPPPELIDLFNEIQKPPFPINPGNRPLLPRGPEGVLNVPKPDIPNNVTPGGQVTPPSFPTPPSPPRGQVTPPSPPPPQYIPPQPLPRQPSYPTPPPQYAPPPSYYPPQYTPPSPPPPSRPPRPRPPRPYPPQTIPPSQQTPPSTPPPSRPRPKPPRPYPQQPPSYTPQQTPSYRPEIPLNRYPTFPQSSPPPTTTPSRNTLK